MNVRLAAARLVNTRFPHLRIPLLRLYYKGIRKFALAVVGVLQKLPVSSEVLGPPKGAILCTPQWIEENHARGRILELLPVEAEEARRQTKRITHREDKKDGSGQEFYIAVINNARICTSKGVVIGSDDRMCVDLTSWEPYVGLTEHSVFLSLKLPRVKKSFRRAVTICTHPKLAENYGHWLFEVVAKFALFKERYGWSNFDHIITNSIQYQFQKEAVELAGIPSDKLIPLSCSLHARIEELYVTPFYLWGFERTPKWVCDAVRRFVLGDGMVEGPKKRRVYLSRKHCHRRKLANEEELLPILEEFGFEEVAPESLTVREQAALFRECELVVGGFGGHFVTSFFAAQEPL